MPTTWKPEAYNSASVYIVADSAQRVIDFLKKTFEATDLRRFDAPDGKIMHAEVRIDDTVIMIADAGGAYPRFPSGFTFTCRTRRPPTKRTPAGGAAVQEPVHKPGDSTSAAALKTPAATPGGSPRN
jgi:uncharacterized glyoxalase superfamily protein PhnB